MRLTKNHMRERKRQRGSGEADSTEAQQWNGERLRNEFRWPESYVNGQPLAPFSLPPVATGHDPAHDHGSYTVGSKSRSK